jgi:hypothetical protein
MTVRAIPARHWRNYGTDPLPTGEEALSSRSPRRRAEAP